MIGLDFTFVDVKTALLVVHLIGLALGVGGALLSDAMFFVSIRDWRISKTELKFLTLGSSSVFLGLLLLIASGSGMFLLDPERYLESSKFIAKMTIVLILIVNGLILHNLQIPHLKDMAERGASTRVHMLELRSLFLLSGVLSIVSWLAALTLGAFRVLPWPYLIIMGVYASAVLLGFLIAFLFRDRIIPVVKRDV